RPSRTSFVASTAGGGPPEAPVVRAWWRGSWDRGSGSEHDPKEHAARSASLSTTLHETRPNDAHAHRGHRLSEEGRAGSPWVDWAAMLGDPPSKRRSSPSRPRRGHGRTRPQVAWKSLQDLWGPNGEQ